MPEKKPVYEVVVGNIGTVFSGGYSQAHEIYKQIDLSIYLSIL